jgi:hypothetical protein
MANRNLLDPAVFGNPGTLGQVLARSTPGGSHSTTEQLTQLVQQLQQLESVSQTEAESVRANTQAVSQNTAQLGQSGSSTAGRVGSALESGLGLGLGLSPLITGLLGLFGGGSGSSGTPAQLPSFALPPAVNVNAGVLEAASTQPFGVDYSAGGASRPTVNPAAAQITVQVQTMDSRSFLDHSSEIAMAVRQAMLESGVLNDVIREI